MTDNRESNNSADIRQLIEAWQLERERIKSIRTLPWRTGTLAGLLTAILLPVFTSFLIDFVNRILNY